MHYIGKILPIEGYKVRLDGDLPSSYHHALSHLYQPLVGPKAIMLYHTLLNDLELKGSTALQTHHLLMNYLNCSLEQIYKARLKLEAIGLLKTFQQTKDGVKVYIYALQSPFSPEVFFKDAMLSELLYHHLGDQKFSQLKRLFIGTTDEKNQGEDITASFHEVFETFQPSISPQTLEDHEALKFKQESIDFDFSPIELALKRRMVPAQRVLTPENKKLILHMKELYQLTFSDLEKAIFWALDENNRLDPAEFRTACYDLFQFQGGESLRLVMKETPAKERKEITHSSIQTKEDQLIKMFENLTTEELLAEFSSGHQASRRELNIVNEVKRTHGLPDPVMNVLIHYVLMQANLKLSKPYLDTIATHWSRARLKTAKEAMAFAKKEIERARNWAIKKKKKSQASKEVIPEWFEQRKKQEPKKQEPTKSTSEKDKQEILSLLRKHSDYNP